MFHYLFIFLLVIVFGFFFLFLIRFNGLFLEFLGLSFLIGNGIYTLLLFTMGRLGFLLTSKNLWVINLFFILFVLISFLLVKDRLKVSLSGCCRVSLNFNFIVGLSMFFLLICLLFVSLFHNLVTPPVNWDSIALYDARARFLLETRDLRSLFFDRYYLVYPLGTSLTNFWVYAFGGSNPSFIDTVYYFSVLCIFFSVVFRNGKNELFSLFFTLLLALNPQFFRHSMLGYSNLPYSVYIFSAFVYLFLFLKEKRPSLLILSSTLISIGLWIRSIEPFWLLFLVLVFLNSLASKRISYFLLPFLSIILVRWNWYDFVKEGVQHRSVAPPESVFLYQPFPFSELLRVDYWWEVGLSFGKLIAYNAGWYLVLYLFSVFLLYLSNKKKILKQVDFTFQLFVLFGFMLFLLGGSFIFRMIGSYKDWNQLQESLGRVVMLFVPFLLFFSSSNIYVLVSLLFGRDVKNGKR